jgi:hypothetical protein
MKLPVVIEPIGRNLFRAQCPAPFSLCGEGTTSAEALASLRKEIQKSVVEGKEFASVEVPEQAGSSEENPWLKMAGMYKDDPMFDEWQAEIQAYRRERDPDDYA